MTAPLPDIARAAEHLDAFLRALGLDPDADAELQHTPQRVAELFAHWLTGSDAPEPMSTMPLADGDRGLVVVSDIEYHAFCVHHLTPFFGRMHIAYLPQERIAGFGAFPRTVQHFCRRPQLQEHLTAQIADFLVESLQPQGLVVACDARQMCMELSGCRTRANTISVVGRGRYAGDKAWDIAKPMLS